MANKFGIAVNPINDYFKNGDWTSKSKPVPSELQNKVNNLFDFIFEKFPDQIVIGLKKISQSKHKNSTDLMKALGYTDLKDFFDDFGFYYDYDGSLAFKLYNDKLANEGVEKKEPEKLELEAVGPAAIPLEKVMVDGSFINLKTNTPLDKKSNLNVFLNKVLEKYPNRMIYKFSSLAKKLSEKMPALRKEYGYNDNFSLFLDYGFTYVLNVADNKYSYLDQYFKEGDLSYYFKPFMLNISAIDLGNQFYLSDELYIKLKEMNKLNVEVSSYLEYKMLTLAPTFIYKANYLTEKLLNENLNLSYRKLKEIKENLTVEEINDYNIFLLKTAYNNLDLDNIKMIISLFLFLGIKIDYKSLAIISLIGYFNSYEDDYLKLFTYANNKVYDGSKLRIDIEAFTALGFVVDNKDPYYYFIKSISNNLFQNDLSDVKNIYLTIKGYKDIDEIYSKVDRWYEVESNLDKTIVGEPISIKERSLAKNIVSSEPLIDDKMGFEFTYNVIKSMNDNFASLEGNGSDIINSSYFEIPEEFKNKKIISIGKSAMDKLKAIRKLIIPKGFQYFDEVEVLNPLSDLTSLNSIEVKEGNEFFRIEDSFLIELTPYGERLVTYFGSSEEVYLPHVREIGAYCFKNRSSVRKIILNKDNIILDNFALADSNIIEVENSECILNIGFNAFNDKIKEFKLSSNLSFINEGAIFNSNVLLSIENAKFYNIYDNVLYVNKKSMYKPYMILKRDSKIIIKDDVKELDLSLFNPAEKLSVELPDSILSINGLIDDLTGYGDCIYMSKDVYDRLLSQNDIISILNKHFKIKIKDSSISYMSFNGKGCEALAHIYERIHNLDSYLPDLEIKLFDSVCKAKALMGDNDGVRNIYSLLKELKDSRRPINKSIDFKDNLDSFIRILDQDKDLLDSLKEKLNLDFKTRDDYNLAASFLSFDYSYIAESKNYPFKNGVVKIKIMDNTSGNLLINDIKEVFSDISFNEASYLLAKEDNDKFIYIFEAGALPNRNWRPKYHIDECIKNWGEE